MIQETELLQDNERHGEYVIHYCIQDLDTVLMRCVDVWVSIDKHRHWAFIEAIGCQKYDSSKCWEVDYDYTRCINKKSQSITEAILEVLNMAREYIEGIGG